MTVVLFPQRPEPERPSIRVDCPQCGSSRTLYFDHTAGRVTAICPNGCSAASQVREDR